VAEESQDKLLGVAAAALVVVIVGALAAAGYFVMAGSRARRQPTQTPAPVAPTPAAPKPSPQAPRTLSARAPGAPREVVPAPEPTPAFEGSPLDWTLSKDQQILFHESLPQGARILLVIMGTDDGVQGTLFLNDGRPALPTNFLVKDESWGQTRHFGGQDILLGLVAVKGPYSETSLRRAAGSDAWWKGKLKPAFQMSY
jgi:hypothetical protein